MLLLCCIPLNDPKGIIKKSIHLPQPVDIERFYPMPNSNREQSALYFVQSLTNVQMRGREDAYVERLKALCQQKGIRLELRVKVKEDVAYKDMPSYLSRFHYLFDREFPLSSSKTALESMAMKIPVISFDMEKSLVCFEKAEELVDQRYKRILNENATKVVAQILQREYLRVLKPVSI